MKVYNFDLLAYPEVPEDVPGTPVPSSYFDPPVGSRNYQEHLEEMAYCEELGFEGVVFNEHHYSAYGTMPLPNLIAAALSQKTKRIKIGVLGNILPLRQHPRPRGRRVRHARLPVPGAPDRGVRPGHSLRVPLVQRQAAGVPGTVRGSLRRHHDRLDRAGMEL